MGAGRDPLRYFRVEARELVDQISAAVLDLDQQADAELIARLLRYAHTLKGAARVVRHAEIAERAHALEEILVPHRGGDPTPGAQQMRDLLRLNDEITAYVAALERPGTPVVPERPTPQPTAEPAAPPASADDGPMSRTATADLDELLDAIDEASARVTPLREGVRGIVRLQRGTETLAGQSRTQRGGTAGLGGRAAAHRLTGELGTLGRRLTDAVDRVERQLDEIRGRAEGLRLVPAGSIFTALHRAVRDAAEAEGKRVRFVGHGGELRMGPQLLAQISGAFLHVVRNAVVHGIERADDRLAAGKPAEGTVVVEVERRGRWATVRCTDDGRGFDVTALRRTAEARGLLAADAPEPDPQTLVDLVLHGGLSTSATVTEVAGRGIGMDVVRDVASKLRGEVAVRTRPGAGSTVEVRAPLTLLSMNGLLLETAGTVVTMPLDAVRRCVGLSPDQAASAAATGRLAYEGRVVPFLPLARSLSPGMPETPDAPVAAGVAVVVTVDEDMVAIGVDRLAGTTTLVSRPLPDLAPAAPVVGSVALDLDGNPRLVLDAHGLLAEAHRQPVGDAAPPRGEPSLPILVVDDSLTTRMLERSILESAGYQVDLAASGEEGLAKAQTRRYGLFLTDVDMPGMDGFTFVERTRADPDLAVVPAILVSSRDSPADRRRGLDAGAGAYVVKGEFDQQELLAHIRRLVRS